MSAGPPGATLKDIGIHYKKRKQCARSQPSSSTPGIRITVFTSPSWLCTKPYLCILPAGSRDGLSLFFKVLPELWSQFLQRVNSPCTCPPSPLCCLHHTLLVQAHCDSVMKAQTDSVFCLPSPPTARCFLQPRELGAIGYDCYFHMLSQMTLSCPNVFFWFLHFFISPCM